MDRYMVAVLAFLVAAVVSRFVAEAGLKSLSVEQKGCMVEAMASFRKYGLVLWVCFSFVVISYKEHWLMVLGFVVYLIAYQMLTLRQVRRLSLPSAYFKYSVASSLIVIVGLGMYSGVLRGWL